MMNKNIPLLIKRIVDYKWHGEGEYSELKKEIEKISDGQLRKRLGDYLDEAKNFVTKNAIEREVEKELLEDWLMESGLAKVKFKSGKYSFDLKEKKKKEDSK